jgi:hypothetical protein
MVKLRNINGSNLRQLEAQLESVSKNSLVVVGVNYVGTNWYIHFLVQETYNDNIKTREELGIDIQSSLPKKKGKL